MITARQPRYNWLNTASVILLFPATYVILISLLKYGFGIDGPFEVSAPFLESMGIKDPPGWNINLLILFGPLLTLFFSAWQVLHIQWHFSREQAEFNITIKKKWLVLGIGMYAGLVLLTMAIYLFGENFKAVS